MKRVRRVGSSRLKKAEDVNKNSDEDTPVRILRSHKRKLAELKITEEVKESRRKVCKSNLVSDGSDCVIVDEVISTEVHGPEKIFTSTPLGRCSKKPKFEESCIKFIEDKEDKSDGNEIIVLSDTKSVLETVVLSESEKSNSEIEILPSTNQRELNKDQKCEQNDLRENNILLNKQQEFQFSVLSNQNSFKQKKTFLRKKKLGRQHYPTVRPTKSEEKTGSESQIGKNIYVESSVAIRKTGLRPIIIDGSNIAFAHSNNKYFSCKGLEICIKYFKKRGHEVIAFVPHYRLKIDKTDNPKLLDQLVKDGDVVLTPSRMVDGKPIVSYDDRFIVQTAVLKGGIIVTKDNYRDLLIENPAWAETIKYRLLQYTWVQDILMFPSDPLGARGPNLEEFLKFGKD